MNPWSLLGSGVAILGLAGLARVLGLGAAERLTEEEVARVVRHERPGVAVRSIRLSDDGLGATVDTDAGSLTVARHGVGTVVTAG